MKIVLSNMQDVEDFVSILSPGYLQAMHPELRGHGGGGSDGKLPADIIKPANLYTDMAAAVYGHDLHPEGYRPEELPTAASADKAVAEMSVALRDMDTGPTKFVISDEPAEVVEPETGDLEELDSTGRRWDEEIDSAAKTKTKAGAWTRSRRRDLTDERYNERAAELIAEAQASNQDESDEEPVATETHALPVDMQEMELNDNDEMVPVEAGPEVESAGGTPGPAVDLAALIEASADASLELSGSMGDLMAASRTFIEKHGVQAMNELRAAVAPDPNNPAVGLSVGSLTPAQRALVQACIQNYPS